MDLEGWLRSLGLAQYEAAFRENAINEAILPKLTAEDLKEIGVAAVGHRRVLLDAIAALRSETPAKQDAPSVATEAANKPNHLAGWFPEAERRQLTVMFCDLAGSTALSTELDPEDLRGVIASYHRCCTKLVESNGGFVAKYMGDGVLAYFGYPQAHEHDAERAVRAALAIVQAVPTLTTAAGSPLQVRIGVATGLVVVGDLIGAGSAKEQAVVGETPNLAARLQALAEPGAVVISSSTHSLTGGLFEYRDLGTVSLKGFAEKVPAWQVLGAGAVESRFEALRAISTPLIGREEEIDLLMRRWAQAKRGEGCVVLVSGEPGIGKSRIAQTVVERLGGEPHIRLRYFCSPHHQDSALYPAIMQLQRAAGFRREDTADKRLEKLEAVLAQGTNDPSRVVPLMADLLSIPIGDKYLPLNLTPQKRKEKTLYAQVSQIEGLAARKPVLIVFEDVQWSDPTTREWLDLVIDRIPALRVLLIITFRPEFTPRWIGLPHVTILNLNRLSKGQRAEMIAHIACGKALPKEIADQIIDRTDGVPLFVEELTKAVVESGVLADVGDRYTVTRPMLPLVIPTSLNDSLLARLDRLASARDVAQIAAALGRSFSHELISAIAAIPQEELDDALTQLINAELIFRRGTPPDAEYTFKHALVQEATYGTLLRSRRQQLHGRITATLEGQFPEIVEAQPERVARHCAEAGLAEKTVGYWLKAGQQAVTRSAMTEAVTLLQKGLDLLTSMPDSVRRRQRELDLRLALRPALLATKGYSAPHVGEAIARARALAEQLDRSDDIVPLLHAQFAFHLNRAEYKLALSIAERMENFGQAQDDVAALFLGHSKKSLIYFALGDLIAARALIEQSQRVADPAHRALYTALTGTDQYALLPAYLALTLTHLGCVDQGRERMSEALSEAHRLEHAHTLAQVLVLACWVEEGAGAPYKAQRYAEEATAFSSEHGFPYWSAWGTIHQGCSLTALGQPEEGLTLLAKGLSMLRGTGAVLSTPRALGFLAEAFARLGRPVEGLNCLGEAAQIIETTDERLDEAELRRLCEDLLLATGDAAAAEASYREALALARRQSAKLWELRTAASLARLWRDQGKRTEAYDLLAPIYGWFTEGFDTPVLRDAKALLDQLA
jgi:predicted ATPase/class 3 adenylate cyclase